MHWILNQNLCHEEGYAKLLQVLESYEIPVTRVKPVPFTHRLLPLDTDTSKADFNVEDIPEPEIDTNSKI